MNVDVDLDLDLEHPCRFCSGSGKRPNHRTRTEVDTSCFNCHGTGVETTDDGKTVLAFVRSRLRGLLAEIQEEDRRAEP